MIDEFQDTSRMQWDNFKLLLLEGLSQGADSLIVGDVKHLFIVGETAIGNP